MNTEIENSTIKELTGIRKELQTIREILECQFLLRYDYTKDDDGKIIRTPSYPEDAPVCYHKWSDRDL